MLKQLMLRKHLLSPFSSFSSVTVYFFESKTSEFLVKGLSPASPVRRCYRGVAYAWWARAHRAGEGSWAQQKPDVQRATAADAREAACSNRIPSE